MNIEQIAALATSGESERLEFKATTGARREAARTLCAFLNQRGVVVQVCGPVWIDRPSISRGLYGACVRSFLDVSGSKLAVRGRGGRIRGSRAPRYVRLWRDRSPGRAARCRRLRGASTELLRAGF